MIQRDVLEQLIISELLTVKSQSSNGPIELIVGI